jgi:hypothetical protein
MADLKQTLFDRLNLVRLMEGVDPLSALRRGARRCPAGCPAKWGLSDLDEDAQVRRNHIFIDQSFAESVAMVLGRGSGHYQVFADGIAMVPINKKTRRFINAFDSSQMMELVDPVLDAQFQAFCAREDAKKELQPA